LDLDFLDSARIPYIVLALTFLLLSFGWWSGVFPAQGHRLDKRQRRLLTVIYLAVAALVALLAVLVPADFVPPLGLVAFELAALGFVAYCVADGLVRARRLRTPAFLDGERRPGGGTARSASRHHREPGTADPRRPRVPTPPPLGEGRVERRERPQHPAVRHIADRLAQHVGRHT